MKCFRHPQSDAVAICKYCCKGACAECAKDTEVGAVCSPRCEEEVRALKAMADRSKQAFPLVAKTHNRNAILLALFGAVFLVFSVIARNDSFMFPFFLSFAGLFVVGSVFSFLMGRKFKRVSAPKA